MKAQTIKKVCGERMMVVNDIQSVDMEELFLQSVKMSISFATKEIVGYRIWGAPIMADYLGYKDVSVFYKKVDHAIASR